MDSSKSQANLQTICAAYTEAQTIGCYLTAILAMFKYVPSLKDTSPNVAQLKKTYKKYHEELFAEIDDVYKSGEASERQKKGYVDWASLIKKRDELAESSYALNDHLLISMYSYIKPRRQDFNHLKTYEKLPEKPEEGNYIVLPSIKKSASRGVVASPPPARMKHSSS